MIYGVVDSGEDAHIVCLPPEVLLECIALNHVFQGGELTYARLQELTPSGAVGSLSEEDDFDPAAVIDPETALETLDEVGWKEGRMDSELPATIRELGRSIRSMTSGPGLELPVEVEGELVHRLTALGFRAVRDDDLVSLGSFAPLTPEELAEAERRLKMLNSSSAGD